jgi:hypothetical protein
MAFGKVIPLTPVRKMHLGPKAPLKTPKQIDRFTECKYVITIIQVCMKTVMHVCFYLRI